MGPSISFDHDDPKKAVQRSMNADLLRRTCYPRWQARDRPLRHWIDVAVIQSVIDWVHGTDDLNLTNRYVTSLIKLSEADVWRIRYILTYLTPDKFTSTEEEAPHPLIQGKTLGGEGVATELHNNNLQHKGDNPDDKEDPIAEDALKDVALSVDFTRIQFVEERHQHKWIEDGREVLSGLRDAVGDHFSCTVAFQDVFTWK